MLSDLTRFPFITKKKCEDGTIKWRKYEHCYDGNCGFSKLDDFTIKYWPDGSSLFACEQDENDYYGVYRSDK